MLCVCQGEAAGALKEGTQATTRSTNGKLFIHKPARYLGTKSLSTVGRAIELEQRGQLVV